MTAFGCTGAIRSRWLVMLAATVGMVHLVGTAVRSATRDRQPDFKNYYYAAVNAQSGADPYDPAAQTRAAGHSIPGRFLYPPITLNVFRPLTALPVDHASWVFLGLKCLGVAGLLALWVTHFNPFPREPWWLLALAVHAVGRPFALDLKAGNIAVFEQLGLWLAILCHLRGWHWRASGLIALTAAFKLTPILFLALGVLGLDPRGRRAALVTGLAFGAIVLNPLLPGNDRVPEFFRVALMQDERGAINPCAMAWFRDLFQVLQRQTGWETASLAMPAYALFVATVAGLGAVALLKRSRTLRPMERVCLMILVYALCVPRLKNYSYLLAIIPLATVLAAGTRSPATRVALVLLTTLHIVPYQQLYTLLLTYGLFTTDVWSRGRDAAPHPAAPRPFPSPAPS
jgi:hypothetical protein